MRTYHAKQAPPAPFKSSEVKTASVAPVKIGTMPAPEGEEGLPIMQNQTTYTKVHRVRLNSRGFRACRRKGIELALVPPTPRKVAAPDEGTMLVS